MNHPAPTDYLPVMQVPGMDHTLFTPRYCWRHN